MPAERRCLILGAGFGTRMGVIGQSLPKVLWPVYGKSLLEMQLLFARRLGYNEIWINLHHQADIIEQACVNHPSFKGVRWLRETPSILDIGGAIHNLAAQPSVRGRGELLVLNADQFLWFTAEELENWKSSASDAGVLLLNWAVNSNQGYNQVLSDTDRRFLRVVPNKELPRGMDMETYSGNSLIRLEALTPVKGPSNFFESVCAPAQRICRTALLTRRRYWDFGTAARYWDSMRGILEAKARGTEDPFTLFLEETGSFQRVQFKPATLSYGTDAPDVIHLGEGQVPAGHPAGVIMAGAPSTQVGVTPCLVYKGTVQPLS